MAKFREFIEQEDLIAKGLWQNEGLGDIASGVGHVGLDVVGLIPGLGEGADLTNALWYLKQGSYFSAAISLISMVPEIGDASKILKYVAKSPNLVRRFLTPGLVTKALNIWNKIKGFVTNNPKLKTYASLMDSEINKVLRQGQQPVIPQNQQQPNMALGHQPAIA